MNIVEICKMMHWDYHTYRKQPQWVIEHIIASSNGESNYQKFLNIKNGRK